jgi:prevent-host-death family protein
MRTVNIADLKNNLSAHLERVRRGEELLVKDGNRPTVRLVPLAASEVLDSEETELAAAGLVRLPTKSLPDSFWEMPAPRVSLTDAVSAVASERDEGWLTCGLGASTAGASGYTYTRMKR